MTITQSFYTFITSAVAVTSITPRIFSQIIPQGQAVPAVTYSLQDDIDTPLLSGARGSLNLALMDVDCWASTLVAAEALATAVKNALVEYVGAFGNHRVTNVAKVRELHLFETDTGYHRVSLQFEIAYGAS